METPVMTKEDVMLFLQMPKVELNKRIKEGTIPCFKIGSFVRFNRKEIENYEYKRGE